MNKLNLVGQKYNRLTVLERDELSDSNSWICLCDCGNIKSIDQYKLKSGHIKSCGCLNAEKRLMRIKKMIDVNTKYTPREATAMRIWKRYNNDILDNISFEDFLKLSQQNCFYCGSEPEACQNIAGKNSSDEFRKNGNFVYNGLDRIDSSKGHMIDNVVPCCKHCNWSKSNRSFEVFCEWIKKAYLCLLDKKIISNESNGS